MCALDLVALQCVTVKFQKKFINSSELIEYKKMKMIQKQVFSKLML